MIETRPIHRLVFRAIFILLDCSWQPHTSHHVHNFYNSLPKLWFPVFNRAGVIADAVQVCLHSTAVHAPPQWQTWTNFNLFPSHFINLKKKKIFSGFICDVAILLKENLAWLRSFKFRFIKTWAVLLTRASLRLACTLIVVQTGQIFFQIFESFIRELG